MYSEACPSSDAGSHEVSSSVPSYPAHRTRYNSLQRLRLSIFESRISEISYSSLLSMIIGGSGAGVRSGYRFGVDGSSMETWNMG